MKKMNLTIVMILSILLGFTTEAKAGKAILIQKEIIINSSIEKAWNVLGPQFADAQKWASSITHSEAKNDISVNGSTCSERGCDVTGMGSIKEKLTQYSEKNHMLSYEVYEGMPKMISYAKNTWRLEDIGNGKTKLTINMEANTVGFMGWMMKGMMKGNLNKIAKNIIEEFKFYIENGTPHERTIKATK